MQEKSLKAKSEKLKTIQKTIEELFAISRRLTRLELVDEAAELLRFTKKLKEVEQDAYKNRG